MQARTREREGGFTLIELLVAMMVTGIVIAALATGFIAAARGTTGAGDLFVESHDAQLLATYFPSDVQSADPLLVKWADTTTPTGCPVAATTSSVLRLQWTEIDASTSTKKAFSASYRLESSDGTTWQLVRYYCFNSGSSSASTDSILAAAGATTKVETVAHNLGSTVPTVAVNGSKISMTLYSYKAASEAAAYSWTISARTRSVGNAAAVPSFQLVSANAAPIAGAGTNLTITAVDSQGSTNTSYTGAHSLTFGGANSIGGHNPVVYDSSGAAVNFGTPTSINFTGGVANVSGSANGVMKLYKAEGAVITVTDGTLGTVSGVSVTVSPDTPTGLSLAPSTLTPNAGDSDNLTITASPDQYGNAPTNYSGAKSLVFTGSSSIGSKNPTVSDDTGAAIPFGSTTKIDFTSGVASVSGSGNGVMTLYKAETKNVVVSDGTISNGAGTSVTVSPAGAASLSLAAAPATAGVADNLTITAMDQFGNTATGYGGSKNLTFSGASTTAAGTHPTVTNSSGAATNFGSTTAITFTSGSATVTGSKNGVMTLYKAETANVAVSDGTIGNGSGTSVVVSPAGAVSLSLVAAPATAGVADNLTITAMDQFGNTATGYGGSKNLTFSGASTTAAGTHPTVTNSSGAATNFGSTTAITFTSGSATVTGSKNGVMTLYKAETANVAVSDGTINSGTGISLTVAAGNPQLSFTNCRSGISGSFGACSGNTLNLGNGGVMQGHVSLGSTDLYGNTAASGSRTVTIAGGDANFQVTYPGGTLTVAPGAESSQLFQVKHLNNANNSATLTAQASNALDSVSITVSK